LRLLVALVLPCFLALLTAAEAQHPPGRARVGYLGSAASAPPDPFAEGLQALGWIEGQNLVIERRYLDGNVERAAALAAELVDLKPQVIVAAAPPAVRAVQRATSSIPVVMFAVADPVGMGFVASLTRPGGNITGLTSAIPEGFMGKQLELIREAIPTSSRVGLLFNAANPLNYAAAFIGELVAAAQVLKLDLIHLEIRSADDLPTALAAAKRGRVDAVFVIGDPLLFRYRKRIHELAASHRLPTFVPAPEYLEGGGVLAYGPSLRDAARRTAIYVDKILKGARPAELPVERPREYRLVLNQRTARQLGLAVPQALVGRADEVIE
jgi:putative tryptophan/tyrosine transport system substrate-binding protein